MVNTELPHFTSPINIVALNINGLQSKLNIGVVDCYLCQFDLICLSETKTDSPDLYDSMLKDYKVIPLPKKNNTYKLGGVHGLCILVKPELYDKCKVIEDTNSECTLWIIVKCEVLGFTFVVGAVYLPCETSTFHQDEVFENLVNDIALIKSKHNAPICLLGDFNARTGILDDFVDFEQEITDLVALDSDPDFVNVRSTLSEAGFITSRHNKDRVINNNGKSLIEICQSSDLKIVNGILVDLVQTRALGSIHVSTKMVVTVQLIMSLPHMSYSHESRIFT